MSEVVNVLGLMQSYAEEIYGLLKRGLLDDCLVARLIDEIEGDGIHVDFLGLPHVTTAVLILVEVEKPKVYVKVVDHFGIKSFEFNLKRSRTNRNRGIKWTN